MKNMIGIMQGRLTPSTETMFFPFETWEQEFEIAQNIGFDAIEWAFYEQGHEENPLWTDEGILRIKEAAKKHNINVPSLCAGYFIDHTFVGAEAEKSAVVLNRLIENSVKIGISIILIPFLGNSEIKNKEQKKEIVKNLGRCVRTAESFGITLALETSLPLRALKEFVAQFNTPLVQVYYDTGNHTTFVGKKVSDEIRELGALIAAVHIKDRVFGSTISYPLGEGETDFPRVFQALHNIGFAGPLVLEAARSKDIDDETLNRRYLQFVKKHLL